VLERKRAGATAHANSLEKGGSSCSPIRKLWSLIRRTKITHRSNDSTIEAVMEALNENGFEGFAEGFRILLNEAM